MPPLSGNGNDGFAPMFAFGAASQSPPASAQWVVSPSSPSSRRSSTSFALPNGNALHPLPSGLSHNNDGRPRSASTPFVSYPYGSGHTRPAGFALSSERGSSGPEAKGAQAGAEGRWSPPIPEDFSRPRSVSIPTNVEQASYRTYRTGSSSFAKLPSMSEYEQELPQPPISVRHGSHSSFAVHASAVPRLAFLGPSDSPSALSSATTDEDELPLPTGYPFKDPTYRPVHPSAAMGMRQVPHLQTTNLGSALPLPPPPMMPASLPSGIAHMGPGSPPTSESSAPSPLSAPSPAVAASPRSQARPSSSKRGRLSLTSNEDPDALPIPPPNPKETMISPTDGTPSENGRYTCPHCREFSSCGRVRRRTFLTEQMYRYSQTLCATFFASHSHALAYRREAVHLQPVRQSLLSSGM